MPLFGSFREVSIVDVITLIARSSGSLSVSRYEGQHRYQIDLQDGHIISTQFNGQNVKDVQQATSFISEIIRHNDGDFEYVKGSREGGFYRIELEGLLKSALSMSDEIGMLRQHFPAPDTRFVLGGTSPETLDAKERDFLQSARLFLHKGASANELSGDLGLYLDHVQLHLYKLRVAGAIEPMRIAYKNPFPRMARISLEGVRQENTTDTIPSASTPAAVTAGHAAAVTVTAGSQPKAVGSLPQAGGEKRVPALPRATTHAAPSAMRAKQSGRFKIGATDTAPPRGKVGALMRSLRNLLTAR